MVPTRRALLATAAAGTAALAGCTVGYRGSTADCPDTFDRPPAESTGDETDPTAYPDPPDDPDADAVGEYVAAFERAYRRNSILAGDDPIESIGVAVGDPEVRSVPRGFVAVTTYTYYYNEVDGPHADSPRMRAAYLVTDTVVRRVGGTAHDAPPDGHDPRSGPVVACLG